MGSRREELDEALRAWRVAERELAESQDGHRAQLEAEVHRLRDAYHRLFTETMIRQLAELHDADQERNASTPSTPAYDDAMRRTQEIAADIWEQAGRDREAPRTGG